MLGTDIRLKNGDINFVGNQDFETISDRANLSQAISNRLQTNLSEYYNIDYGSEIFKTLGSDNSTVTANRIRGYTFECLLQDKRISTIESIVVTSISDGFKVDIEVMPNDTTDSTLTLGVTIN